MNTVIDTVPTILAQVNIEITPTPPPFISKFYKLLAGAVYVVCVLALIVAGAMLGWERWSLEGDDQSARRLVVVIVGAIVICSTTAIIQFTA